MVIGSPAHRAYGGPGGLHRRLSPGADRDTVSRTDTGTDPDRYCESSRPRFEEFPVPTGPLHARITADGTYEKCRCTIGEEHDEHGVPTNDYSRDEESLSVHDAADIWRSSGMDED